MSNIRGKIYALTAFTRMPPLRTYGLRLVFALIRVSLMSPLARGFISGALLGVVTGALLALIALVTPLDVLHFEGSLLRIPGGWTSALGFLLHVLLFGVVTALVGRFYQPKWSILGKIALVQQNLVELSFIHFARWVIIKRRDFPRLSDTQPVENFNYDYLFFESNFNGDWEKYIDAFSQVIPGGMDNVWRWSVKYPGSRPITPFLSYIRNCQYDTDYYYSAYPEASTNDIVGALSLAEQFQTFVTTSATLPPDEFVREYNRFLARVQNCLSKTSIAAPAATGLPARTPRPAPAAEVAHV